MSIKSKNSKNISKMDLQRNFMERIQNIKSRFDIKSDDEEYSVSSKSDEKDEYHPQNIQNLSTLDFINHELNNVKSIHPSQKTLDCNKPLSHDKVHSDIIKPGLHQVFPSLKDTKKVSQFKKKQKLKKVKLNYFSNNNQ
jgi:hypothetical protein